jgi:hypothetical protein
MNNLELQKTLFIDIETVSMTSSYAQLDPRMQKLWDKKSKTINRDELDSEKTFEAGAGIYAEFGKIVCVSLGYFLDKELKQFKVKSFKGDNEVKILQDVYDVFDKFLKDHTNSLAGHNIKEFDVPYLCRRTLINKLQLPFFLKDLQNRKPWENPLIDTLHIWRFGDYKHYISLELMAGILGVPTPKDDIDGSMVSSVYWQEQNVDRIALYCSKDVLTVAQILLQLNGYPLIAEENVSLV